MCVGLPLSSAAVAAAVAVAAAASAVTRLFMLHQFQQQLVHAKQARRVSVSRADTHAEAERHILVM